MKRGLTRKAPLKAQAAKPKPRKCRVKAEGCEVSYIPRHSMQPHCFNPGCAVKHIEAQRAKEAAALAKKQRAVTREVKQAFKSRAKLLSEAQTEFNCYVRLRDGEVCISCGNRQAVQYHAGHYMTTKARPGLRFHPANASSQCSQCNLYHSGRISDYRPALIGKVGQPMVDYLETAHPRSDWTREEIAEIKAHFRQLARELRK